MSDLLTTANNNVDRYSKRLAAVLEPQFGDRSPVVVATMEALILAHIQKTIAQSFGALK